MNKNFIARCATVATRKPVKYQKTGTRALAKFQKEIRIAVALGLTQKEIARELGKLPVGENPFRRRYFIGNKEHIQKIAPATRVGYVNQLCNELNISRRPLA